MVELTPNIIGAIKIAINLGEKLQKDIPQLANDYRKGKSREEIIKEYGILRNYEVSKKVAYSAISYALRGNEESNSFNGSEIFKHYNGLIDKDELKKLSLEHRLFNLENTRKYLTPEVLKNTGLELYKQGKGIHGLSHKVKSDIGKRSAEKRVREKIGIFGMSREQLQEFSRKSNLSQGFTLWTEEEREMVCRLSQLPKYKPNSGKRRKRMYLIAKKINRTFHQGQEIRTEATINHFLSNYKRRNKNAL